MTPDPMALFRGSILGLGLLWALPPSTEGWAPARLVRPRAVARASRTRLSSAAVAPEEVAKPSPLRRVSSIRRFVRLPFWPIWSGVCVWLLERLGLKDLAAAWEERVGGRVCPMIFLEEGMQETDPFIMNVHHHHSFSSLDPLRHLQHLVWPEGFPSHPHAGFCTLTYVLQGKVRHRDSMGVRQVYGDGAVQYLRAGSGVLHEEMWELPGLSLQTELELFQIWVNLPEGMKALPPKIQLAGTGLDQALPEVEVGGTQPGEPSTRVRILIGSFQDTRSPVVPDTRLTVLHCRCSGAGARLVIPAEAGDSVSLYVRRGRIEIGQEPPRGPIPIETFQTAFFQPGGLGSVEIVAQEGAPADFLVMMGEPLREPVVAEGPWVFTNREDLQRAYYLYQAGAYGRPWDHKLDDSEWLKLCRKPDQRGDDDE